MPPVFPPSTNQDGLDALKNERDYIAHVSIAKMDMTVAAMSWAIQEIEQLRRIIAAANIPDELPATGMNPGPLA